MVKGILAGMLAIESVSDIRTGTISVKRQIFFLVAAAVLNIVTAYQSLGSVLGGLLIGGMMYAYAFITHEGIGYGDCLIFVTSGLYIGFLGNMRLLFGSLVVASLTGIVMTIVKKRGMKYRIPFVPCVFVTYIIMLVMKFVWRLNVL